MSTALGDALGRMDAKTRAAFLAHVDGYSSANWLSDVLARSGMQVSATTLKRFREQRRAERGGTDGRS